MVRRRKRRKKNSIANDFVGRFVKAVVAILILTAFVLGIAFSVKQISAFDAKKIAGFAGPYLSRLGFGEKEIGQVAGKLFESFTDLGINGSDSKEEEDTEESKEESGNTSSIVSERKEPEGLVIGMVAILADSHIAKEQKYVENKDHLRVALGKIKELGVEKVVHVGDITNWGVLGDLKETKTILDETELSYYSLPGDADLAASGGRENFLGVFDKNNYTFKVKDVKFVLLDNSANYTLIPEETMSWFAEEVKDATFVILSQPLYTEGIILPPFNYIYMGNTREEPTSEFLVNRQNSVREQRDVLLDLIRASDAQAVIAGDHHKSSKVVDTTRPSLEHHVVGAISSTVSKYAQSILEPQSFSVLKIYENGAYSIETIYIY